MDVSRPRTEARKYIATRLITQTARIAVQPFSLGVLTTYVIPV